MIDFQTTSYDAVSSTMDVARDALKEKGSAHGHVFTAQTQTAGRGRHARIWSSEPGNLFASLILEPQCSLDKAAQLSLVMAIAIGEALLEVLPQHAHLSYKWPNDILIQNKKICGILLEAEANSDHSLKSLIIGFGLNIKNYPDEAIWPATALSEYRVQISLEEMLKKILEKVNFFYTHWCEHGLTRIRTLWMERAYGLDKPIKVQANAQEVTGRLKDLSADGALLLDHEGKLITITSGEVYFKD